MRPLAPLALALLTALALAPAARAQEAVEAAALLREAEAALATPKGAARLAALGAASAAQEKALAALRAELRRIAQRRADLAPHAAERGEAAVSVALALDRLESTPPAGWFLHPDGPLAASRAGLVMAMTAPKLAARAAAARADLAELDALEAERRAATAQLQTALGALRAAQTEVAAENAGRKARTTLPPATQAALDAARGLLARSAATLADAITAMPPRPEGAAPEIGFAALKGLMPPPAAGRVLTRFDAPSLEGRARGVTLATAPYALVRAPALATLRYAGPVGRFAQVAILEPEPGALIVLAGLAAIDRAVGETVLPGEPIGSMGGPPPDAAEFLVDATHGSGTLSDQTLYIELRRGGAPVDPAPWFAFEVERTNG